MYEIYGKIIHAMGKYIKNNYPQSHIKIYNYRGHEETELNLHPNRAHIKFEINGNVYYMQFPSNGINLYKHGSQYFKTVVQNGKFSLDYYMEDSKTLCGVNDIDRVINGQITCEELAKRMVQTLFELPFTEKYVERRKTRVYNIYDDGYHYEYIQQPERFEKIWW